MTDTLTRDILALRAAIDTGDDTALPILADALEEMGDPRSAGLRTIPQECEPVHYPHKDTWFWRSDSRLARSCGRNGTVSYRVYQSLPYVPGGWRAYPTRSAAYLALAQVLADPPVLTPTMASTMVIRSMQDARDVIAAYSTCPQMGHDGFDLGDGFRLRRRAIHLDARDSWSYRWVDDSSWTIPVEVSAEEAATLLFRNRRYVNRMRRGR